MPVRLHNLRTNPISLAEQTNLNPSARQDGLADQHCTATFERLSDHQLHLQLQNLSETGKLSASDTRLYRHYQHTLNALALRFELACAQAAGTVSTHPLEESLALILKGVSPKIKLALAEKLLQVDALEQGMRRRLEGLLEAKTVVSEELDEHLGIVISHIVKTQRTLLPTLRQLLKGADIFTSPGFASLSALWERLASLWTKLKGIIAKHLRDKDKQDNKRGADSLFSILGSSSSAPSLRPYTTPSEVPTGNPVDGVETEPPPKKNMVEEIVRCLEAYARAKELERERDKAETLRAWEREEQKERQALEELKSEFPELLSTPYASQLVPQPYRGAPDTVAREHLRQVGLEERAKRRAARKKNSG